MKHGFCTRQKREMVFIGQTHGGATPLLHYSTTPLLPDLDFEGPCPWLVLTNAVHSSLRLFPPHCASLTHHELQGEREGGRRGGCGGDPDPVVSCRFTSHLLSAGPLICVLELQSVLDMLYPVESHPCGFFILISFNLCFFTWEYIWDRGLIYSVAEQKTKWKGPRKKSRHGWGYIKVLGNKNTME